MSFLFSKKVSDRRVSYKVLGMKISFKNGRPSKDTRNSWRLQNANNETIAKNKFDINRVRVGRFCYGAIDVEICGHGKEELIIGDFCSIGPNVKFILESEHPYKGFSTYPFKVKMLKEATEAVSKGSIIIKDDVWIGYGSIILAGITIGQGAVIAAGSVVVKDVEPYSIVGGNPAQHIKYRFDEKVRKKMLEVDFSNLTEKNIKENIDVLYTNLTEENVDKIIKDLTVNTLSLLEK